MLRLTYERTIHGLTKAELSRKAGLDQSLISKIEKGRVIPYKSELEKISLVLGVAEDELMKEVPYEG